MMRIKEVRNMGIHTVNNIENNMENSTEKKALLTRKDVSGMGEIHADWRNYPLL